MQPNQGERSDGGEGQQPFLQRRSPNMQINPIVTERTDSMIFGYLRRRGYHNTANALEQESQHIPIPHTHTDDQNRSFVTMTVNDRLHDLQLEEVITNVFLYGHSSGIHQNLSQIGDELQRVTNRVKTMVSNSNRSHIHEQLYKRSTISRQQQQQLFTMRPSQQAIAQMELQRMNRIGELRYREEQNQRAQSSSSFPNLPSRAMLPPSQDQIQPVSMEVAPEEQFYEQRDEHKGRRKSHPHNMEVMSQPSITALVDICNYRVEGSDNIPSYSDIREEFLTPYMSKKEQQEYYNILQDVRSTEEQIGEVHNMIVHDIEEGEINEDRQSTFGVEPLISPLGRDLFGYDPDQAEGQERSEEFPRQQNIPNQPSVFPNNVEDDRDRRNSSRNSRRSISPLRVRDSDNKRKHREREKEKERGFEKSTNQERGERRKDSNTTTSSSTHKSHRSSEKPHTSHVQSDRESTSSSSSRVNASDRKEEKERKRREKEQREAELLKAEKEKRRREQKEAERERVKEKEKMKSSSGSTRKQQQDQASILLNQARQHAAGSSKQSDRSDSSKKRKVGDDTSESTSRDHEVTPFKIPKKNYSSTPFTKTPSTSSEPSTSRQEKSNKSSSKNLSDGDGREDSTHFIEIDKQRHPARLTSILLTCETSYRDFHDGLQQKNVGKAARESPYYSEETSGPITPRDICTNPKGKTFAPFKGPQMIKKSDPSTSSGSSNEKDSTSENSSDGGDLSNSDKSRSQTPEVKMSVDIAKADRLLERIHRQK